MFLNQNNSLVELKPMSLVSNNGISAAFESLSLYVEVELNPLRNVVRFEMFF